VPGVPKPTLRQRLYPATLATQLEAPARSRLCAKGRPQQGHGTHTLGPDRLVHATPSFCGVFNWSYNRRAISSSKLVGGGTSRLTGFGGLRSKRAESC
jgi:hypothetical protein